MNFALVIPTLNEAENIGPQVGRIRVIDTAPAEIIFVDDNSTDGTRERIRSLDDDRVRLVERNEPSLGLAGAVIAGARVAHNELLVVMDADLSHPPEKIPELVRPFVAGQADMVIGSRYIRGATTPGWPIWRKIMSRIAAGAAYPLTHVHDSMCGFFAIGRDRLLELAPHATGFKIAFETIVYGRGKLRVLEVPIAFRDRARGTSKMSFRVALRFFARWISAVLRLLFRRTARG